MFGYQIIGVPLSFPKNQMQVRIHATVKFITYSHTAGVETYNEQYDSSMSVKEYVKHFKQIAIHEDEFLSSELVSLKLAKYDDEGTLLVNPVTKQDEAKLIFEI